MAVVGLQPRSGPLWMQKDTAHSPSAFLPLPPTSVSSMGGGGEGTASKKGGAQRALKGVQLDRKHEGGAAQRALLQGHDLRPARG